MPCCSNTLSEIAKESQIGCDRIGGMDASGRRLRAAILLLLATLLVGVAGYQLLEGWSALDALYMTVITLATVGYGETHPLSSAGRVFTIALIMTGVGVLTYGVTAATAFVSRCWALASFTTVTLNSLL